MIDYAKVKQQKSDWAGYFSQNDRRGEAAIRFAELGEQAPVNTQYSRGYETLTFNILFKHLRRVQAEAANLDLSLLFYPLDDDTWDERFKDQIQEAETQLLQAAHLGADNATQASLQQRVQRLQEIYANARQHRIEEQKNHQAILNALMLDANKRLAFQQSIRQVYSYGYSVLVIKALPDIQGDEQFQKLEVECLPSPTAAFFDRNATTYTKTDGRFAGYRYDVTRAELMNRYADNKRLMRKLSDWSESKKLEVIEYYYRDKKPDGGLGETIYYTRFIDNLMIEEPVPLYIDLLPVIYHSGLTVWNPEQRQEVTIPFIEPMKDAAKLHNYLGTQIANLAKQTGGRKIIVDKFDLDKLQPPEREDWDNFERRSGLFVRPAKRPDDPPGRDLEVISPMEIPQTLTENFATSKQEVDEIAGAFLSVQGAQDNAVSGVAIDARVRQANLLQNNVVQLHNHTIKIVGEVIKQWLPYVYHQTQTLTVRHKDNSLRRVTINKKLLTGSIKNDLHAMTERYSYELELVGSSKLDEENTREYLTQIYQLSPQAFQLTADLYAQTLDIKDRDVLARRLKTMVDPLVIRFGDGDMNFMEFSSQRQQMQQQAAQANPQMQLIQSKIQNEQAQTQTQQFEAQTKRQQLLSQIEQNSQQLHVELEKLEQHKADSETKNIIALLHAQLEHNNQLLAAFGVK